MNAISLIFFRIFDKEIKNSIMPNQFHQEDQEVEIREYEVTANAEPIIREEEVLREREHEMEEDEIITKQKNRYGWAFFLCSFFVGLGVTASTDAPIWMFLGLGVGFLFFVDPIYHRVMDLFE
jgi:hypothetical protein